MKLCLRVRLIDNLSTEILSNFSYVVPLDTTIPRDAFLIYSAVVKATRFSANLNVKS